jgi:tetratricopeptide (TPR) repeat protein
MGGTTPSDKQSPSGVRSLEWWVQQVVPPLVSVAIPLIGGLVIKLWTGNTHLAVDICLGILVLVSFALFLRFIRQPLRYYALVVSILSFITLLALVTSQPLPWSRSTSQANQIHDKPVLILVARFSGPTPNNYSVTQTILGNLRNQLRGYSDVGVEPLRQEITEEDDYVARVEGKRRKAAIVIWGRYIPSSRSVGIAVHFTVLKPPPFFPALGSSVQGKMESVPLERVDDFTVQSQLSNRMAYLTLFVAGMTRLSARDYAAAIHYFNGSLNQTSEKVSALNRATVYYFRAIAYGATSNYSHAIHDLSDAINRRPDYYLAYNARSVAYDYLNKPNAAIADASSAIKLMPSKADAYVNRAAAYGHRGREGDVDRAISDCNTALRLSPNLPEVLVNRGNAYAAKGQNNLANSDFTNAIRADAQHVSAYMDRALLYWRSGREQLAVNDFTKAIQLDPKHLSAYKYRGEIYADEGRIDLAISDFTQAIRLDSRSVETYIDRGLAYSRGGDFAHAITDYSRALKIDRTWGAAYFGRGVAYQHLGQRTKAIADFQASLKYLRDPSLRKLARGQIDLLRSK